MAQIPNLDNATIDLASLREQSKKELLNILKNIRGKKCLVIEPKLSGSLSLIVETALLKEHGAELRLLSSEPLETECTKIVYLVSSKLELMKHISLHLHDNASKGLQRECFLYFIPRRSVACEQLLKEKKVHEFLTIGEYPLYMIPLDEDVISFELDFAYKECLVDADTSSLWHVAKAIHKLESSFGVIPNVRAKGKASLCVAEILDRMQLEDPVNTSDAVPEISTLILLDREVDMVTPMCSQLTYEGLVDEFFHVNSGAVELDASIMDAKAEGKKVKVPLNSSDKLFKETRDLNFEVVVQVLRQKAMSIKQDYADISATNQSVSELKDFVKKLNTLPEMNRHISLAQHLSTYTSKPSFLSRLDMEQTIVESESYDICFEYIEEMIHKQESLFNVLRLLILFSVTNSGLPKKQYDYLRRELLHSYGFEHVATLNNLEKAGLFRKQELRSNWLTVKRALNLVVENVDTADPKDISYVFSGYAPLSVRLIQQAIRSGWRPIEEILKLLPGPHLETKRGALSRISSYESLSGGSTTVGRAVVERRSLVLVVFIGGVTFAEISALRFLTSQDLAHDVIIATTKVINGQTLLEPFVESQV
ncbi:vacuolar protein-sorting-associated protein 33 homolog [Silene latifolia]|uniref:vacuolar protein-sorting-associated protein 33 homolog n=1 Tax=Silene latifolia TaxID=37657 RepID=UPI003D78550F